MCGYVGVYVDLSPSLSGFISKFRDVYYIYVSFFLSHELIPNFGN